MMNKSMIAVLVGILFVSLGCRKRLDGFLFNNSNIEHYFLDNYDGESELELPPSYYVPSDDIYLFSFPIEDKGEVLNMYAIYVGDTATIDIDTVILYCHGNKDHMDNYWPRQKLLSYVGGYNRYGVLMFDYPGYGLSEGKPTEENMYIATDGALKWLKNRGLTNERLVVYGYSLGSAPASKSVGDKAFSLIPNKVILEAPFASSEVMVQDGSLLNMPSSFFVNTQINNVEQMEKCEVPLYWLHGVEDDFLALDKHGQLVYDNHTKSWKIKSLIEGAGHTDIPTFMGYDSYRENILNYIKSPN